jgi:hypothetical protein
MKSAKSKAFQPSIAHEVAIFGSPTDDMLLEQELLSDFGETLSGLEAKRAHSQNVVSFIERVQTEKMIKSAPLHDELSMCDMKLIQLRYAEDSLLQQMEALKQERELVMSRQASLRMALSGCQQAYDQKLQEASSVSQSIILAMQTREAVSILLTRVKSCDERLVQIL